MSTAVAGWSPTSTLGRAVALVVVLCGLGLALRRPDVVAYGAPLAFAAAFARRAARPARLALDLHVDDAPLSEGGEALLEVRIESDVPLDVVVVDVRLDERVAPARPVALVLGPGEPRSCALSARFTRWGTYRVGPASATGWSEGLGFVGRTSSEQLDTVRVLPGTEPFRSREDASRALARAGEHRSARIGEGIELAGVRPFQQGDRLRRLNWPASLRTGALQLTTTRSDDSTHVALLLDTAFDAGDPGGSALDQTVRAAAAIATHFLSQGDAVSLVERSEQLRRLRAGLGGRQLERVQSFLLGARARRQDTGDEDLVTVARALPAGSLVFVLTPLLDASSVELLALLHGTGRVVAAVDTLPPGVRPKVEDVVERAASSLYFMEREQLLSRLSELGVPVATWAGPYSLDAVLVALSQMARAPRLIVR